MIQSLSKTAKKSTPPQKYSLKALTQTIKRKPTTWCFIATAFPFSRQTQIPQIPNPLSRKRNAMTERSYTRFRLAVVTGSGIIQKRPYGVHDVYWFHDGISFRSEKHILFRPFVTLSENSVQKFLKFIWNKIRISFKYFEHASSEYFFPEAVPRITWNPNNRNYLEQTSNTST